jgi:hypothetical protein
MIWPAVFFSGTVLAVLLMERAIGKNLENSLRQLLFLRTNPRPSPDADVWLCIAVACFVVGSVFSWRAFKGFRHVRRAQQGASNGGPATQHGDSDAKEGPPSVS